MSTPPSIHTQRANVLHALRKLMPALRPSEQKVANYVLEHPSKIPAMRIVDLAVETNVSEPTVVRFCRSLGYRSYQQFKINLAQNLAVSPTFALFHISDKDSPKTASLKVFDATINSLLAARNALPMESINKAVQLLQNTRHLEIYGYGTSAAIARDAQHKFFRLIHSTIAYDDPHVQSMSAANMASDSMIIAISQSGRSRNLIHAVQIAKNNQVPIIAICPGQTQLSALATIHLEVDLADDFNMFSTMSSRIVQLVMLDLLVIGMAMRTGQIDLVLRKISESQRTLYEPYIPPVRKRNKQPPTE